MGYEEGEFHYQCSCPDCERNDLLVRINKRLDQIDESIGVWTRNQ